MRGSKAKRLRKVAEKLTVGYSKVEYWRPRGTQVALTKKCTRYLYKRLKSRYLEASRCQDANTKYLLESGVK